jgi:nickel-dependent lactate racemase
VVSCGGYPNDETLYIAHRSLELTREATAAGGEVLWLAECRNGIASARKAAENFFDPLKHDTPAYIEQIQKSYVMFSHKTVKFVQLMRHLSAIHVVSELPTGTLPVGRMLPCDDPRGVVQRWVEEGQEILFIDGANELAVTVGRPRRRPARPGPSVRGG